MAWQLVEKKAQMDNLLHSEQEQGDFVTSLEDQARASPVTPVNSPRPFAATLQLITSRGDVPGPHLEHQAPLSSHVSQHTQTLSLQHQRTHGSSLSARGAVSLALIHTRHQVAKLKEEEAAHDATLEAMRDAAVAPLPDADDAMPLSEEPATTEQVHATIHSLMAPPSVHAWRSFLRASCHVPILPPAILRSIAETPGAGSDCLDSRPRVP